MGNPKEEAEKTNLETEKFQRHKKCPISTSLLRQKMCTMHMLAAFDILTQFRFTYLHSMKKKENLLSHEKIFRENN